MVLSGQKFSHVSGAEGERPEMGQDGAGTYPPCQRRCRSAASISATTLPRLPVVQSERAASAAALEPCCKEVPGAAALRHDARSRAHTHSPPDCVLIHTAHVP